MVVALHLVSLSRPMKVCKIFLSKNPCGCNLIWPISWLGHNPANPPTRFLAPRVSWTTAEKMQKCLWLKSRSNAFKSEISVLKYCNRKRRLFPLKALRQKRGLLGTLLLLSVQRITAISTSVQTHLHWYACFTRRRALVQHHAVDSYQCVCTFISIFSILFRWKHLQTGPTRLLDWVVNASFPSWQPTIGRT